MVFIDWWNGLSLAAQIFTCIAIPATLLLVLQTVMMLLGFGDDADGAGDVVSDTPELADADGIFGEDLVSDDVDFSGLHGLKIFTLRGIVAFFVVFGWTGILMDSAGSSIFITVPVAAIFGFAIMFALALLLRSIMKLRNDGNADNKNAIGVSGRVHLVIPPSRSGDGKVHIMLQGTYVERNAVTDEQEPIPTGAEVVVVGLSGQTDLVVVRK